MKINIQFHNLHLQRISFCLYLQVVLEHHEPLLVQTHQLVPITKAGMHNMKNYRANVVSRQKSKLNWLMLPEDLELQKAPEDPVHQHHPSAHLHPALL